MEVYIEFAIVDNLVIDYLLLYISCYTSKVRSNRLRLFIGSAVGTIFAICLTILDLSFISNLVLKFIIPFPMIICVFGIKELFGKNINNLRKILLFYFIFLAYTFLMGGLILAVFYILSIRLNSFIYLSYTSLVPVGVIVAVIAIYIKSVILITRKLDKSRTVKNFLYDISFNYAGTMYNLTVFLDSGNFLKDTKTNLPVVIVSRDKLKIDLNKLNSIEFSTASNTSGNMKILYPSDVRIFYHKDKEQIKSQNIAIGVLNKNFCGYDGLLPYSAIC